jgi:hypothetical protein
MMNLRKAHRIAVLAAGVLGVSPALAQDKASCLDAAAQGQQLRDSHKLVEAREQLRICAASACPVAVQSDCAGWLDSVEKALPSIVAAAKTAAGSDLVDVRVTVDGRPFAVKLDGEAIPMDPGLHVFHFEAADGSKVDQRVVVGEGQRNLRVAVVLEKPVVQPPPMPAPPEPNPGLGTQKVLALVAGGVGVVGLGLGTVLGVLALSERSDAETVCAGTLCPTPDGVNKWSSATSTANISSAMFAVGVLGVAGGAALWLTAPSATGPQVGLGPGLLQVKCTW